MTLDQLLAFGAYVNAGFVDFYDGRKHLRLGSVDAAGSPNLSAEGLRVFDELMTAQALAVLKAEPDNAPTKPKAKSAAKAAATATAAEAEAEAKAEADLGAEIDALLVAKT